MVRKLDCLDKARNHISFIVEETPNYFMDMHRSTKFVHLYDNLLFITISFHLLVFTSCSVAKCWSVVDLRFLNSGRWNLKSHCVPQKVCFNFEDKSPFCRATETPVLDFWWRMPWVSRSITFMLCHFHVMDSSDSSLVQHLLSSWQPSLQLSLWSDWDSNPWL